jgi:subfamily B ATP-binding cassette protein MsbA
MSKMHIEGYRKFTILMVAIVLISSVFSLISPILINYWSNIGQEITNEEILILLGVMILATGTKIVLTYFREKFAKEFNKKNFKNYLSQYYKLDYDYITEQGPMTLMERMIIGVNSIYQYLTGDAIQIYSNILILLGILTIVFLQNKLIFLILFLLIPLHYFGYKHLNKELSERSKELQEISSTRWRDILSILNQTDYIKQLGDYQHINKIIDLNLEEIYKAQSKVNVYAQSSSALISGISNVAQTMIMVLTILRGLESNNYMSILLISVLIPLFNQSLQGITNSNLNRRDFDISNSFFSTWKSHLETEGSVNLKEINSLEINLDEMRIGDHHKKMNLNERYLPGDFIWVKGDSGTGKSTLLKLIPRFRSVDGILINGRKINEYTLESLRNRIEYLSQNVPIIKGTLRDNLFLDIPYSSKIEEEMKKDPLLASIFKNKTMDSIITEGAGNLSGGEKQKIAVARILYKDVDLLLLDEITSGIDEETAKEIYDRIFEKMKNKIVFVISHNDLPSKYTNKIIEIK